MSYENQILVPLGSAFSLIHCPGLLYSPQYLEQKDVVGAIVSVVALAMDVYRLRT